MSVEAVFEGECIKAHLLPGDRAVDKEWKKVDRRKLVQALDACDRELGSVGRVNPRRWTRLEDVRGGGLWELRAPPRGNNIFRALIYNPHGFEWYIALVRQKKSQQLPKGWVPVARNRIAEAQQRGDL